MTQGYSYTRRGRGRVLASSTGVGLLALIIFATTPAAGQQLVLSLTTSKGCIETGQDPVYEVGERITITFRIGSDTVPQASATLFDMLANGQVNAISFGQLVTNRTYSFAARIGPPTDVEKLVLRAAAPGVTTQRRSCSFTVVSSGTPVATRTPTPTKTPRPPTVTRTATMTRPTRTVTRTRPPTATRPPGTGLEAKIRTHRGCREDGDAATFRVGEGILVSFRVLSDDHLSANASIGDTLPSGTKKVFAFGTIPTNLPLALVGRVGRPTGIHTLRLRASAGGETAEDTCSFLVVGSIFAPPRTRTPTP